MSDISEIDEPAACSGGTGLALEVYNDLLCPICLEFFKHPIILSCSHVLCRSPCAENLFDFNFIRCPVCRENCYVSGGIASLPRVIPLESIIEKYRLERRKVIQNARRAQRKTSQSSHVCAHKAPNSNPTTAPNSNPTTAPNSNSTTAPNSNSTTATNSNSRTQENQSKHACVSKPQSSQGSTHDVHNGSVNVHHGVSGKEPSSNGTCSDSPTLQWSQRHSGTCSGPSSAPPACCSINEHLPFSPDTSCQSSARSEHCQRPSLFRSSSTPRNWERFDASLFDVSTDSVTSCSRHGSETSVYCQVCERCVCDVCGDVDHVTSHVTNSVEEAARQAKDKLLHSLERMTNSQIRVLTSLEQQRQRQKDIEQIFYRKTEETNMQCDSLLAEVEHKRSLFLADLEQEERMRRSEIDDVIEILEKILASSQSLAQYTKEVLDKDSTTILQVTPALNEQLVGSVLDCEACQGHPDDLHPDLSPAKVVDLRKEQAVLRDIHYLHPPSPPSIDLGRCARSENTVALFLQPPRHSDVIDSYVISYCSEEQKALGVEETLTLDHPTLTTTTTTWLGEHPGWTSEHPGWTSEYPGWTTTEHPGWTTTQNYLHPHHHAGQSFPTSSSTSSSSSSSAAGSLVLLVEHLLCGSAYFFSLGSANRAGRSLCSSELVHCRTLTASYSVVPVPVILEAMCHTYPSSIRIYTPSPHDVAPEQSISHFLLYRPRDRKCLWRCLALCGRVEERVFGLEPSVRYEFVVMAKNARGECQVSEKLVLETDSVVS